VPLGWGVQHQPVVVGTFTVTVGWRRPGGTEGSFDPNTHSKTTTPNAAYATGSARVQVLPALQQEKVVAEDDQVTTVGYRVSVPVDSTDYKVNDLGTITAVESGNGDPSLVGKVLTVVAIERGSLMFERDLIVIERLG
jgi:hypothetical protein